MGLERDQGTPGFSGLAILLELVETSGVWPQGLLDAFFAMMPKADGDSTPPRSTTPQCAPGCVFYLWVFRLSRGKYLPARLHAAEAS